MDFEQMKDDEVFFGAYNAVISGVMSNKGPKAEQSLELHRYAIHFGELALSVKWDREEQREFDFIQASEETPE